MKKWIELIPDFKPKLRKKIESSRVYVRIFPNNTYMLELVSNEKLVLEPIEFEELYNKVSLWITEYKECKDKLFTGIFFMSTQDFDKFMKIQNDLNAELISIII